MHAAPPPSPRRISTTLIANPQQLIFSWEPALEYDCPTLEYNFTSENCGSCAIDSQVVSCTEFQASPAGINCNFTVWSIVCGNVTGQGSMLSANVTLQGYYSYTHWKISLIPYSGKFLRCPNFRGFSGEAAAICEN
jgi:hypothetical protein